MRNTMAAIQEQRLSDIGSPAIPADDSRSSLSGIADTSLDSGFAPSASVGLSTRTRPSRSGSIQSYKSLPREPVGSTPNLHAPSDHSLQELPSPSGSARPPPSVITAREQRRRSGSLTELSARMHTRWWENEVETLLKVGILSCRPQSCRSLETERTFLAFIRISTLRSRTIKSDCQRQTRKVAPLLA